MLQVGSDPEVFLRDKKTNSLVNALCYLQGSKANPFKTKYGSIQPDNILGEFNSIPAKTAEEFVVNHKLIIRDLEEILSPLDLTWEAISSSVVDEQVLLSDPRSFMSGCDPDFNVWKCRAFNDDFDLWSNDKADYLSTNLRVAGGHLHISFDSANNDQNYANRFKFVKALDYSVGVASVIFDQDNSRRTLYGKAGCFRPKDTIINEPYNGIEYRTLSNFWIKSEDMMRFVFEKIKEVDSNLDELAERADYYKDQILFIINKGDVLSAINFCNMEKLI